MKGFPFRPVIGTVLPTACSVSTSGQTRRASGLSWRALANEAWPWRAKGRRQGRGEHCRAAQGQVEEGHLRWSQHGRHQAVALSCHCPGAQGPAKRGGEARGWSHMEQAIFYATAGRSRGKSWDRCLTVDTLVPRSLTFLHWLKMFQEEFMGLLFSNSAIMNSNRWRTNRFSLGFYELQAIL